MIGKGDAAQITIRSLRKRVLRHNPEVEDNYDLTKTIYNLLEKLSWATYWDVGFRTTTKEAVVRRIYALKKPPFRSRTQSCPAVLA